MAIKAVFLDIDGTLVRFREKTLDDYTRDALTRAHEKGVALFVVTGRFKTGIGIDRDFPFDGYGTANGAYCFLPGGEVVHMSAWKPAEVEALVRRCQELDVCASFTEPDAIYFCGSERAKAASTRIRPHHTTGARPWGVVGKNPVLQVVVDGPEGMDEQLLAGIDGLESARWSPEFIDVVEKGRGKGDAIDAFCARLGITPSECMAIGDGGNDVHMIRHAGVGVAMGQARDSVKAAADVVAPSVDDHGAAWAIEHFAL